MFYAISFLKSHLELLTARGFIRAVVNTNDFQVHVFANYFRGTLHSHRHGSHMQSDASHK